MFAVMCGLPCREEGASLGAAMEGWSKTCSEIVLGVRGQRAAKRGFSNLCSPCIGRYPVLVASVILEALQHGMGITGIWTVQYRPALTIRRCDPGWGSRRAEPGVPRAGISPARWSLSGLPRMLCPFLSHPLLSLTEALVSTK